MLAQAKRDMAAARGDGNKTSNSPGDEKSAESSKEREITNKRVTPTKKPKAQSEGKGRPTPSRKDAEAKRARTARPKTSGKKRR